MVDDAKLHQFMGQMLSDLGGAVSVALVRMGDALGLMRRCMRRVGAALGAQADEARLREVITAGGPRHVRRAAETPFNMILEARP